MMSAEDSERSEHTIEFLDSFADLEDPRQQAKVLYPLEEILLLCLCAVLSGAECWVEVALYGQQRLQDSHDWPGLRSIAKVESRRELIVEGKVEQETRYYISSLPADATQIAAAVREHWGVENGLHWVMDMVFRDDECRIRTQNAPANFATIKHMASNLLRRGKGKHSMRSSRHIAAWNEDFLFSLLTT